MFKYVLISALVVLTNFPNVLSASSFAMLVGVSDYDQSIGLTDLRGPSNDVRLLRDVLTERGGFNIQLLADGVDGAERPTRNAILDALDAIVAQAEKGDFVYLHFSGHGTQQIDKNGDETDGMDEVFLPADTARAEPGSSVIPNAIVDEEFGQRIAALRTKGTDVWFVLDSCHSGSGLRAGSPRIATRFVDPATLGVSVSPSPENVTTAAVEEPGGDDLPGRYLAFYAAQSSEVAREIQIDENTENSWYGLFTSRLAARLQSDSGLSYRQLFQAVLGDMNSEAVPGAARLQTPLWEGNLIDAPVFGGGDVVGIRQFSLTGNRINAGKLHGLRDNTVVALVSDAAAAADDILAFAQLEKTDALSATLAAVGGTCVASVGAPCARTGNLSEDARYARIVASPHDKALRIAPPSNLMTSETVPANHPLFIALKMAVATSNSVQNTNIVIDINANVLTGVLDGALWFGPKLGIGNSTVGLRWSPEDGPLEPLLLRIVKAEEIASMLQNVAGTPSILFPSPVEIQVQRLASDVSRLAPSLPDDLYGECSAAMQSASATTDLASGQSLKQCDYLAFGAQGIVQGGARDVNRVYIDSQYCTSAEYQLVEGVSQPATIGEAMTICSDCPDQEGSVSFKAGAERMFFVVTEAEPNSEALNLAGLIQTCGAELGGTRSAATRQVDVFLSGLASQNATRGSFGAIGISKIWVEEFNWQVLPRREALAQAGLAVDN